MRVGQQRRFHSHGTVWQSLHSLIGSHILDEQRWHQRAEQPTQHHVAQQSLLALDASKGLCDMTLSARTIRRGVRQAAASGMMRIERRRRL